MMEEIVVKEEFITNNDPEPEKIEQPVMKSNFSAKVEKISVQGNVFVRFSKYLVDENFDHSLVKTDYFDLYILPADQREEDSTFRLESVNFTWSVTSFKLDLLELKLEFFEPVEISPLQTQDSLVIHFKEETIPIFEDLAQKTLAKKVKKQLSHSEFG